MMLTEKETGLLNDLKTQEQLCVEKYGKYAQQANDPALSQLFDSIRQVEQRHVQMVDQMLQGTLPQQNQQNQQNQQAQGQNQQQNKQANQQNLQNQRKPAPAYGAAPSQDKQLDTYLCQDALSMEKHVSSLYDVSIFEFADPAARQALNAIQADEQHHGEQLYAYMARNGMYA